MKILKRVAPKRTDVFIKCRTCSSVIQYEEGEFTKASHRNEDYIKVDCPVCGVTAHYDLAEVKQFEKLYSGLKEPEPNAFAITTRDGQIATWEGSILLFENLENANNFLHRRASHAGLYEIKAVHFIKPEIKS